MLDFIHTVTCVVHAEDHMLPVHIHGSSYAQLVRMKQGNAWLVAWPWPRSVHMLGSMWLLALMLTNSVCDVDTVHLVRDVI